MSPRFRGSLLQPPPALPHFLLSETLFFLGVSSEWCPLMDVLLNIHATVKDKWNSEGSGSSIVWNRSIFIGKWGVSEPLQHLYLWVLRLWTPVHPVIALYSPEEEYEDISACFYIHMSFYWLCINCIASESGVSAASAHLQPLNEWMIVPSLVFCNCRSPTRALLKSRQSVRAFTQSFRLGFFVSDLGRNLLLIVSEPKI